MKTVYFSGKAINALNSRGIYDTQIARYKMDDGLIYRIPRESLDTTAALSTASHNNPGGWEQVEIRVKGGGKKNV